MSTRISRTIAVLVAALTLLGVTSVFNVASAHPSVTLHSLGAVPNTQAPHAPLVAYSGTIPASVDLSADNPPVGDQDPLDSCVAWSTGYYMRGWYAKRDGYYSSGSFAPMYTYAQIVQGINEGTTFDANLNIQKQQGLDTASDYVEGNYDNSTQPSAAERTNAARFRISSYNEYGNPGGTGLQTWAKNSLAGGNPLAIAIPIYPEFDNASATNSLVGVPTSTEKSRGDHAVFAYGYDQNGLLIENSWGTGWGNSGYGELSWAFVNKYGEDVVSIVPQGPSSGAWQQLPGGATDIAVGGDGSVWALGTTPVYGGYGIFRWNASTWSWSSIPGGAVRIAVDPGGKPWVVNSFGNIFRWSGLTWVQVAGAARDIGVGADGSIWVVGYSSVVTNASAVSRTGATTRSGASTGMSATGNSNLKLSGAINACLIAALNPNDGNIFRLTLGGWQQVPGEANRISVGPDGNPWITNSCGAIFRWTGSTWQRLPGAAKDIGVGGGFQPGTRTNLAWVLGTNAVGGGYQTYRFNGSGWDAIDGGAIAIAVGPSGNAWVAANDGSIWEFQG